MTEATSLELIIEVGVGIEMEHVHFPHVGVDGTEDRPGHRVVAAQRKNRMPLAHELGDPRGDLGAGLLAGRHAEISRIGPDARMFEIDALLGGHVGVHPDPLELGADRGRALGGPTEI